MCLNPFFSLTPNAPWALTYDASQPQAAHAHAALITYGGITSWGNPPSILQQSANNEVSVGSNAVLPTDLSMSNFDDISRRCGLWLHVTGYNVDATNQYLVVFRLRGGYEASAQFFIGHNYLESHPLTAIEARHAILIDCPGNGLSINVYVRLASPETWDNMTILGVDCCLI